MKRFVFLTLLSASLSAGGLDLQMEVLCQQAGSLSYWVGHKTDTEEATADCKEYADRDYPKTEQNKRCREICVANFIEVVKKQQ